MYTEIFVCSYSPYYSALGSLLELTHKFLFVFIMLYFRHVVKGLFHWILHPTLFCSREWNKRNSDNEVVCGFGVVGERFMHME